MLFKTLEWKTPREYNSTSERSTEDLGELYFRVLWSKSSTIKHRSQNWEEDDVDEKGPYILLSEMEKAIKYSYMLDKKVTGEEYVSVDLLKLLGENRIEL